jgi:hypothetical protein
MKNVKLLVLFALMLSALISGFARQLLAPNDVVAPSDIPFMLFGVFLLFLWFRLDSDERSYRRSALLNVGVIARALVALPYYFFRTRGFARGLAASVLFLVAGLMCTLLQYVGAYLSYVAVRS